MNGLTSLIRDASHVSAQPSSDPKLCLGFCVGCRMSVLLVIPDFEYSDAEVVLVILSADGVVW